MADRELVVAEVRRTFEGKLNELEDRLVMSHEGEAQVVPGPELPDIGALPPGELPDRGTLPTVADAAATERDQLVAAGTTGLRKVIEGRDNEITPREQVGLEAIIVLEGRPPLFIQGGDFLLVPPEWQVLSANRDQIKASIARVGRVEVTGHPDYEWIGTGWLAGPDAIITNRHVAREFSRFDGAAWTFETGMSANLDFNAEHGAIIPLEFQITGIIGIHEQFDLAALRIAPTGGGDNRPLPSPLDVATADPGAVAGRQVYLIGYPAWDGRRNDPAYMRQIFSDIFDVKRLQPGKITAFTAGDGQFVHDCSTLGGNSGSPVFDLDSHQVVGLHFGGRYLIGNNAVPLWQLTSDPLLSAAGINFV
jgi:hypothetical protein